jgi:quinol monooxygenase YgiN
MVVEYIRYAVKDEQRREELVAAYVEAAKSLDAAPECLAYEMTVCEEDALAAVLRIEWTSTEAHLGGFRKSAVFRSFFAAIGPFVKEIAEMRHYALTPVVSRKQPAA